RDVQDVQDGKERSFPSGYPVHPVHPCESSGNLDWTRDFACPEHQIVMGETQPYYFSFNESDSACATCLALGTNLNVHPDLLAPDKSRSILGGAFIQEAFKYDKNSWSGRLMYSLSRHLGFSLETPFRELPPRIVQILFYGTSERFPLLLPDGATKGDR